MKDRPSPGQIPKDVYLQLNNSSYLNGFSSQGIGLCKISRQEDKFATTLLSQIWENDSTEISFQANEQAIKPLSDLFYNAYRQSGQTNYQEVGIGFPMFYIKTTEKESSADIAAPLFIWRVNYRPDYADKWHLTIKRNDVLPNKLLLSFFEEKYNLDLSDKFDKCLHTNKDLGEAIYHLCYELIVQFDLTDNRSTTSVLPAPISIENTKGSIRWSGILNLFGVQQPKLLNLALTLQNSNWQPKETPSWQHTFGVFPTDPMQELVMQYFQTHNLIVDGDSGTGVFQTAANIAANCLSNDKNLLIVSRKCPALSNISRHLASRNLDQFCLNLFGDQSVRDQSISQEASKHDKDQYNLNLQKAMRNQATLSDQYNAVTQPIFGKYNWTNVVGLFLAANGKEPSALLNSHLNFSDYQWSYKVFTDFSQKVENGIELFKNIGTTDHPLGKLNRILFLEYPSGESRNKIEASVGKLKKQAYSLQKKYINKLHTYTVKLTHYYNDGLKEYQKKSDNLLELIGDLDSEFGEKGTKTGLLSTGKLKLKGIFSTNSKNILDQQNRIRSSYQFMLDKFSENQFFEYSLPEYTGSEKISEIQTVVQSFRTALQEFQQTIPQLIQSNLETLSQTNHVEKMGYKTIVIDLDFELRKFIKSVNNTQLFEESINSRKHASIDQQNQLEQIVNQLDGIDLNLRDFNDFHIWQKYWLELSKSEQKIVLALTRIKPDDWVVAFQSWYLHQFLSQYHNENIPEDDLHYQRFLTAHANLEDQITSQITTQQKMRKTRSPRINVEMFTNANQDFSAIQFLHKNISNSSNVINQYPVILTTPEVAMEWIDSNQNMFDTIIILDSNELNLSSHFPLLEMAPRIVSFTNSRSGCQTTNYTILDCLIDQDTQEIDLLYHHRPGPSAITDLYYQKFKSARDLHFYNKTKDKNAIVNIPLDLSYRSEENTRIHYAEVLENILKEIKPFNKNYQFPKLRIIIEDEGLRSFLFYRLYHKRVGHTPMAGQLQKLFPNGIKIYTPANQASDPTDYLLYLQSSDASFKNKRVIQNHLAWTRQKIFFIHSDQVSSFSSTGIENAPIRKKYRRNPQCDYFIDEMVESLSNHIHPDQLIKHAWINELYVPLLIKSADIDSAPIAIILDGIADRRGGLALDWEIKHRALLKFYGLEYVYVWSSNWWKNESEAVSNLINKIEKLTAEYVG